MRIVLMGDRVRAALFKREFTEDLRLSLLITFLKGVSNTAIWGSEQDIDHLRELLRSQGYNMELPPPTDAPVDHESALHQVTDDDLCVGYDHGMVVGRVVMGVGLQATVGVGDDM